MPIESNFRRSLATRSRLTGAFKLTGLEVPYRGQSACHHRGRKCRGEDEIRKRNCSQNRTGPLTR